MGTNTYTTVALYLNARTLSLIGGYGEDSDGDGLPDGYEVLATRHRPVFGGHGHDGNKRRVQGPGRRRLQQSGGVFQRDHPLVFDTPAAPGGFYVHPTGGGGGYLIEWQAASGPVQGYVLTIADLYNNTLATIDLPASQLSYAYTNSSSYRFYLSAQYAGGLSAANLHSGSINK